MVSDVALGGRPAASPLYALVTEAIDRRAPAAGAFSPEGLTGPPTWEAVSQAVLSTLDAHNANGWGWQSVTVAALGCYRTGAADRPRRSMLGRGRWGCGCPGWPRVRLESSGEG